MEFLPLVSPSLFWASFMDGPLGSTVSGVCFTISYKTWQKLYWSQNQLNRFSFSCVIKLIITEGLFLNSRNLSHGGGKVNVYDNFWLLQPSTEFATLHTAMTRSVTHYWSIHKLCLYFLRSLVIQSKYRAFPRNYWKCLYPASSIWNVLKSDSMVSPSFLID